jgi:hypothetical protein
MRRKRRGPALFQLLVVAGFLALVWFSFGQNVLAPRKQPSVPEKLGVLELVDSYEGAQALAQIRRLHGGDVGLVSAIVAEYAHAKSPYHSGNERLTVWIGRAESRDAAVELTHRMIDGIEKGGAGFSNLQQLTIAGHEVFQVDGPGGQHFFYQSRERVIWLTTEAADAMPLLQQALKIF